MSIDMFVGASQSQASSVLAKSKADEQAYEKMIQALQQFIDEERLTSTAYDNGKQFYQTVLIPLVKAGILLSEAVSEACQKFVDDYQATVDSGDLQSDVLEEKIRQLNDRIGHLEAIRATFEQSDLGDNFISRQLNQNSRLIELLVETKKVLQEKLEKLLAFHASSPEIFAHIAELEALVNQGASQAEGAWTGSGFSIPADLSWTTTVSQKWQARAEKLKKQEQAFHKAKIKELKQYKVYAVVYTDVDGKPRILWQLKKNGKGVTNPELYHYISQFGVQLPPDSFKFIDYNSWEEKVQNGWRKGYNYITGETYNGLLGGILATSQCLADGVTWLNKSDLGVAIQTLGFTYASYRMMTKNGTVTIENEKASEANSILTPEVEAKILEGQRKGASNGINGGHSPNINNTNPNFAMETIKVNSDGTKVIKYTKQFPDGNISKIKMSTVFPDDWSDEDIIKAIQKISNSNAVGQRSIDGLTLHRGKINGIEIDVFKKGNEIISGYPVGGKPTPGFDPIK